MKNIPPIIAALHLPALLEGEKYSVAEIEDYMCQNLDVFQRGGIPAVILQDESRNKGLARIETVALMASLARLAKKEFPSLELGVIIESHDPYTPIAVARAAGLSFVRIKVFVGAMLKSSGVQEGCGIEAVDYRNKLGGNDIMILADVHDRTGFPLVDVPMEDAAKWASNTGADSLVLTGMTFNESLQILDNVRGKNLNKPLYIGGSVTIENVDLALDHADGAIVSSSLKKTDARDEIVLWDIDLISRFMEKVRNKLKQ
ncbi:MAG: BtpA/SgcQ family protein [Anaerolineaceae bacterium]|jgi:membrane complex biogenesis BtpA family protein|nr:BtpA/SgcQ family protein [Anaerolineaceae bacterium]